MTSEYAILPGTAFSNRDIPVARYVAPNKKVTQTRSTEGNYSVLPASAFNNNAPTTKSQIILAQEQEKSLRKIEAHVQVLRPLLRLICMDWDEKKDVVTLTAIVKKYQENCDLLERLSKIKTAFETQFPNARADTSVKKRLDYIEELYNNIKIDRKTLDDCVEKYNTLQKSAQDQSESKEPDLLAQLNAMRNSEPLKQQRP